ncbi:MAG: tetraacyldisaccharide 4'-kinase, partial [Steroidobacteraceae bacterium]
VGDEALLIARRTGVPVVVGRDRVAAARLAIELGADVIVSDDGLQHLRLARDFEVAVIDGARGLGNGRLLPAGPLREPAGRLASVNAVVIHGTGRNPLPPALTDPAAVFTMQLVGAQLEALQPVGAMRGSRPLSELRGVQVHAVAGIGYPQRFFAALRAAGLEPIEHAFPDHHAFAPGELAFGDTRPVVMTEKDAVKCSGFDLERAWVLPVSAEIGCPAELLQSINTALEAAPTIRRGGAPREA